ncbi:hypothetical protein ABSA28_00062 [Candidatus Hepatincolaceae symbiont of Richtersius coronifer]
MIHKFLHRFFQARLHKVIIIFVGLFFLNSCGTLLSPKSSFTHKSKEINYGILALDSIGLLVLIFPGLIALGVDHITGALYLTPEAAEERAANEKVLTPASIRKIMVDS